MLSQIIFLSYFVYAFSETEYSCKLLFLLFFYSVSYFGHNAVFKKNESLNISNKTSSNDSVSTEDSTDSTDDTVGDSSNDSEDDPCNDLIHDPSG